MQLWKFAREQMIMEMPQIRLGRPPITSQFMTLE